MKNSASFVKGLREKLECTQAEFARIVDVTATAVSRWENDHAQPSKSKWELMHNLDDRLRKGVNPQQVKNKLLILAGSGNSDSPIESLEKGEYGEDLKTLFTEENLFERIFLESGIDRSDLLIRKFNYWRELLNNGEIPINNVNEWKRLSRYVFPLMLFTRLNSSGFDYIPNELGFNFSSKVSSFHSARPIEREPLNQLESPVDRIEGVSLTLVQVLLVYSECKSQLIHKKWNPYWEPDYEDPNLWNRMDFEWSGIVKYSDQVYGNYDWEFLKTSTGERSLNEVLNDVSKLCRQVLEDIELSDYYQENLDELKKTEHIIRS